MQKWEYFFIEIPNNLKNIKIEGEKVDVREYMNSLGNQG